MEEAEHGDTVKHWTKKFINFLITARCHCSCVLHSIPFNHVSLLPLQFSVYITTGAGETTHLRSQHVSQCSEDWREIGIPPSISIVIENYQYCPPSRSSGSYFTRIIPGRQILNIIFKKINTISGSANLGLGCRMSIKEILSLWIFSAALKALETTIKVSDVVDTVLFIRLAEIHTKCFPLCTLLFLQCERKVRKVEKVVGLNYLSVSLLSRIRIIYHQLSAKMQCFTCEAAILCNIYLCHC